MPNKLRNALPNADWFATPTTVAALAGLAPAVSTLNASVIRANCRHCRKLRPVAVRKSRARVRTDAPDAMAKSSRLFV